MKNAMQMSLGLDELTDEDKARLRQEREARLTAWEQYEARWDRDADEPGEDEPGGIHDGLSEPYPDYADVTFGADDDCNDIAF
jgi:hypothetical protein